MMSFISATYAIELLKKALEIYTPSKQEYELARLIADKASNELGFEKVYIDDVGNVIARKGYGTPRVLLCGHMDTVPEYIPVSINDGFIYGRGASDAKAPLISLLLAGAASRDCGTIIFAGLVDEEGNATGIKNLLKELSNGLKVDYAIFGEPSGIDNITIAYKGRVALDIRCSVGNSAHASAPMLAGNAIEEAFMLWQRIKDSLSSIEKLTYCLTEINGGTSHNVTPAECEFTVDIRIPNGMRTDDVLSIIDKVIKSTDTSKVKVDYSTEDKTEPFEARHDSPLVRALVLGVMDVNHKRPMLIRKSGTGDMNVLGNTLNIPVVTYGPGDARSSHTKDEYVSLDEFTNSIDIIKRSLYHLSRLHKRMVKEETE